MLYLSHCLAADTPRYGNSGALELKQTKCLQCGDTSNNTDLLFGAHTGTHIDAPLHFDPEGAPLESFPPEFWICEHPWLIEQEATPGEIIGLERWLSALERVPEDTDLLLVKTGFEQHRAEPGASSTYIFQNPGFAPEVGLWLRTHRKLRMIGFDFISLTSYTDRPLGRIAHRAFLAQNPEGASGPLADPILIVEDMHLADLTAVPKRVIVAPLRYTSADGAPVTVLAELP
ncbi:MAG: cyclase family protein [bacterium]|jgi:arylformamidase